MSHAPADIDAHGCGCLCGACQGGHAMKGIEVAHISELAAADLSDMDAHVRGHHTFVDDNGFLIDVLPYVSEPVVSATPQDTASFSDTAEPNGSSPQINFGGTPVLNSNLGAAATLFLDFDGHFEATWGSYSNITTPAFDLDGNASSFSLSEQARIVEIWHRVSEDFAPFNINVTTVNPGSFANGQALRVAIGGSSYDWLGAGAGGVAYIDTFTNSIVNTVYVFPAQLGNGWAKYVAEATSHEAGHAFGLLHQSSWSGNTKTEEYNPGGGGWAPIMGNSYAQELSTWHDGRSSTGATQTDLTILTSVYNGFGYRADDHGNSNANATLLPAMGPVIQGSGIITQVTDTDVFSFDAGAGTLDVTVNGASVGTNLNIRLDLYDNAGQLVASSNPGNALNASITTNLTAGRHYLHVRSTGEYARIGQYSFSGLIAPPEENGGGDEGGGDDGGGGDGGPSPALRVTYDDLAFDSGTLAIDLGVAVMGEQGPTRTLTIHNDGDADMTLGSLTVGAGFTVIDGLAATIAPGASDMLIVGLDTTLVAQREATLSFVTNDTDAALYTLQLAGDVYGDRYENNDNRLDTDAHPAGEPDSPNFGVLEAPLVVSDLNTLDDPSDWYRFQTVGLGGESDFVRIDFNHADGDLDMILYRLGAGGIEFVASSTGVANSEIISLAGEGSGVYYVQVYGYRGATNPQYALTIQPASSMAEFGDRQVARYTDIHGNAVTVKLSGPGFGQVDLSDEGPDALPRITLTGTTDRSSLTIDVSGRGFTTAIGDIQVEGPINRINAGEAELRGDLTIDGTASKITFAAVNGSQQQAIVIGEADDVRDTVTLDLGEVVDLTLHSDTPVKKLTLDAWHDNVGVADELTTQLLGTVKGAGTFEADVTTTILGAAKLDGALREATWTIAGHAGAIVAGSIDDTFAADVGGILVFYGAAGDAAGAVEAGVIAKVVVGGTLSGQITATAFDARGYSIGTLRAAQAEDATITTVGGIHGIKAEQWINGSITAAAVGVFVTKGAFSGTLTATSFDIKGASIGTFAAADVTDGVVTAAGGIRSIKVNSWVGGSIEAQWFGAIKVAATLTATLAATGSDEDGLSIRSLTLGDAQDAVVTAPGDIQSVRADSWGGGSITAHTIASFRTDGDFTGELTVTGMDERGLSITSMRVGAASDAVVVAEGGIKTIRAESWIGGSVTAQFIDKLDTRGTFSAIVTATGQDEQGQSIGLFEADQALDTVILAPGFIKKIRVNAWHDGSITAASIDKFVTDQDMSGIVTLTGENDEPESIDVLAVTDEARRTAAFLSRADRRSHEAAGLTASVRLL